MISELETSLSSPNKAISTGKSTKDNSKVNGQLRSRIKVLEYSQEMLWLLTHRNSAQCISFILCSMAWHSRHQRPHSFWTAPRITTSVKVQHWKSMIYRVPVTLHTLSQIWQMWLAENMKQLLCVCSELRSFPDVVILGADLKGHGLWGWEQWLI